MNHDNNDDLYRADNLRARGITVEHMPPEEIAKATGPLQVQDVGEVPTAEEIDTFAKATGTLPDKVVEGMGIYRTNQSITTLEEALKNRGVFTDAKGRMRLFVGAPTPHGIPRGLALPSDDEHEAWVMREPFWLAADRRVLRISKMETNHLLNTINYLRRASGVGSWNADDNVAADFDCIGFSHLVAEAQKRKVFRENDGVNKGLPKLSVSKGKSRRVLRRVRKAVKLLAVEMGEVLRFELNCGNDHCLRYRMRRKSWDRNVTFERRRAIQRVLRDDPTRYFRRKP